jgi:hypothetical protein
MRNREIDDLDALRQALGQPAPPKEIRENYYGYGAEHLEALARLKPDERAAGGDLAFYARVLRHGDVQKDLLQWVLPFCLRAWREDLRGESSGYGGFVEWLYPALVDGQILDSVLTPNEAAAVSSFMREAILEEIDAQRGLRFVGMGSRPYGWVGAVTTYGVLLPDLERLWTEWWSCETLGRAIASVQYITCLTYGEEENPVFAPWTPTGGGGPPGLWEFEGHLYTHRWLAPNVAFLQSILTADRVIEVLRRAVARMTGYQEHETAVRVLADVGERKEILESRCDELPRILESRQDPNTSPEWSE